MNFKPVATLEELDGLDEAQIIEGFLSAERGDPEPGENRGKAYWHGWCNRQRDYGLLTTPPEHKTLIAAWVSRNAQDRKDWLAGLN